MIDLIGGEIDEVVWASGGEAVAEGSPNLVKRAEILSSEGAGRGAFFHDGDTMMTGISKQATIPCAGFTLLLTARKFYIKSPPLKFTIGPHTHTFRMMWVSSTNAMPSHNMGISE